MTHYETLYIVHPAQTGRVKEFADKFKQVIERMDGTLSHVDEWGLRDLAYQIGKQGKGYYTLLQYQSSARGVEELERNMKLTEGVLRYLTVRLDGDVIPQPEQKDLAKEPPKESDGESAKPGPES